MKPPHFIIHDESLIVKHKRHHAREMRSSPFNDGRRFLILAHFSQIFREFDKKSEKKDRFFPKKVKKKQNHPKSSAKNTYT